MQSIVGIDYNVKYEKWMLTTPTREKGKPGEEIMKPLNLEWGLKPPNQSTELKLGWTINRPMFLYYYPISRCQKTKPGVEVSPWLANKCQASQDVGGDSQVPKSSNFKFLIWWWMGTKAGHTIPMRQPSTLKPTPKLGLRSWRPGLLPNWFQGHPLTIGVQVLPLTLLVHRREAWRYWISMVMSCRPFRDPLNK